MTDSGAPAGARALAVRESIEPTYNLEETGPRFTVESRLNDKVVAVDSTSDPFVFHRVTIGWRDLLGFILGGRRVEFILDGDPEIVEDVCELNADYLGQPNSTRRAEFNERLEQGLRSFAQDSETGSADA